MAIAAAQRPLMASRALAIMTLVLWVLSLTQPALIIDNGTGEPAIWSGAQVLGMGWLGLGLITAGWYANPPFLIAAITMLVGPKLPWKMAMVGLLLALDTFRLQEIPGGGRADVYGYGPGVALWFAAFGLLLLALAWRSVEHRGRTSVSATLRAPAVFSVVALLGGATTFYGIQAHRTTQHSSITEAKFLPAGSVKNGEVCKAAVLAPITRLTLDGPLEVRGQAYALGAPATLLGWGIPVVRKGGFDFALNNAADINSIYWKPAVGPAAAILNLSMDSNDTIEATLSSADESVTVFRQTWARDLRRTSLYCPDYRPNDPTPSSPPRSLLTAAVDVPGGLRPPSVGTLQSAIVVEPFRPESLPSAKTHSVPLDAAASESVLNAGCPTRARFVEKDPGAIYLAYGGQQTFAIDEHRYFLMNNQPLAAVCASDSVYLYYFWLDSDRKHYLLYIQRRQLEGFRKIWTLVTRFDYARPHPFRGSQNVKLRSLQEKDGMVIAEIVDVEQSLAAGISFPAPVR